MKIALELASSAFAIAGQLTGSTSRFGSVCYAVGGVLWILWMVRYRQWGFIPINVVGSGITAWNLLAAFR